MANNCTTHYKVLCPDKDILQRICDAIEYCNENKEPLTPDSSNNWTGNIFKHLGLKYESDRTFWYGAYIENDVLNLFEEGKWTRGSAMRQLVNQFPDPEDEDESILEVYFYSEEPGCGIYETNDYSGEYFPDEFVLDTEDGTEYCEDFSDLCEKVNEFLDEPKAFLNFQEMESYLEVHNKEHREDGLYCYVYEIQTTASLFDY